MKDYNEDTIEEKRSKIGRYVIISYKSSSISAANINSNISLNCWNGTSVKLFELHFDCYLPSINVSPTVLKD